MILLDGRTIQKSDVFFDAANYRFQLSPSGEDITTLLKQADKRLFNGFDVVKYNEIVYAQHYYKQHGTWPNATGSTSIFTNFVNQLATEPLAAPLAALDAGVKQLFDSAGFKTIAIGATILIVALLVIKLK